LEIHVFWVEIPFFSRQVHIPEEKISLVFPPLDTSLHKKREIGDEKDRQIREQIFYGDNEGSALAIKPV
jgi:hypothetical protein